MNTKSVTIDRSSYESTTTRRMLRVPRRIGCLARIGETCFPTAKRISKLPIKDWDFILTRTMFSRNYKPCNKHILRRLHNLFSPSFQLKQSSYCNRGIKMYVDLEFSNAVCWYACWSIDESSNGVRIARWVIISELYAWATTPKMGAVLMEAADRSCQACIPPVTLGHCLCHRIYPLIIRECLVI